MYIVYTRVIFVTRAETLIKIITIHWIELKLKLLTKFGTKNLTETKPKSIRRN